MGVYKLEKLVVKGPTPLKGEVTISGAKNAAVAILPATLLIDGVCTIENLPNISDIKISCTILEQLGAKITWNDAHSITIDTSNITTTKAPLDLTSKFRASYYIIGAMLSRKGEIEVGMPGGCKLGARPIDQHIKGFELLGANVTVEKGKIYAKAKKLKGCPIYMDIVSASYTSVLRALLLLWPAAQRGVGLAMGRHWPGQPDCGPLGDFPRRQPAICKRGAQNECGAPHPAGPRCAARYPQPNAAQ